MAELLTPERLAEIKQRAEKAAELRGAAVDIDQCYKDRAALVAHIAAQDARHEADVAALQEIGRGVEADQAKIAALQAERDADNLRFTQQLERVRELKERSETLITSLRARAEAAESSLADAREKLAQADAVIYKDWFGERAELPLISREEYRRIATEAIARHRQRQTSGE